LDDRVGAFALLADLVRQPTLAPALRLAHGGAQAREVVLELDEQRGDVFIRRPRVENYENFVGIQTSSPPVTIVVKVFTLPVRALQGNLSAGTEATVALSASTLVGHWLRVKTWTKRHSPCPVAEAVSEITRPNRTGSVHVAVRHRGRRGRLVLG